MRNLNIVVVFDGILRPDTTGRYVVAALRELGHQVTHYMPCYKFDNQLVFKNYTDILFDDVDFLLYVDDDINYPVIGDDIPGGRLPRYYWCIDTHRMDHLVGGGSRWDRLQRFTRNFLAQRDRAQEITGIWLPLAFDPKTYRWMDCAKTYDWSFIGNLNDRRKTFFAEVRRRFPNCFIGNAYGADANMIYNQSRIALNLTFSNDINMRFFEAQATSAMALSNRTNNGETSLFSEMGYFDDLDDCLGRMEQLLANGETTTEIARRQARDVERHTYKARMEELLAQIEPASTGN